MIKDCSHIFAAAKSLQSCPTLCDPINGSPPGSPIPGFLQARTLEWVAISFSSAWKWKVKVKSLNHVRLLATPWTPWRSLPGSSVHGIFQARILDWVAIAFSRKSLEHHIQEGHFSRICFLEEKGVGRHRCWQDYTQNLWMFAVRSNRKMLNSPFLLFPPFASPSLSPPPFFFLSM